MVDTTRGLAKFLVIFMTVVAIFAVEALRTVAATTPDNRAVFPLPPERPAGGEVIVFVVPPPSEVKEGEILKSKPAFALSNPPMRVPTPSKTIAPTPAPTRPKPVPPAPKVSPTKVVTAKNALRNNPPHPQPKIKKETEVEEEKTKVGEQLAERARQIAAARNRTGKCYRYASKAIEEVVPDIEFWGIAAATGAEILDQDPRFRELKGLDPADLPYLPAGAVVVWGKTRKSKYGHISIALGDGREASDHIAPQITSLRGYTNFRVFIPLDYAG